MSNLVLMQTPRRDGSSKCSLREHTLMNYKSRTPMNTPRRHTPRRVEEIGSLRVTEPTFSELYPDFHCDALGGETITQLLLTDKEDSQKLPGLDMQKAQHMALYRFLLHSDKAELYRGTADAKGAALRAAQMREASEGNLLNARKKVKKSTPRSPKRKVRAHKQQEADLSAGLYGAEESRASESKSREPSL